jgi:hypothetical protein
MPEGHFHRKGSLQCDVADDDERESRETYKGDRGCG